MPVPRRKTSRARRNYRRAHQHLPKLQVQKCSHCGSPKMSHRVCVSCGYLKDTEVVRMKTGK